MSSLFLTVYFSLLVILVIYGLHRYYLVYLCYRHKDKLPIPKGYFSVLPRVTIQLPIYNEIYVAERVVSAACSMDYPKELLQIQILDDSTDSTYELLKKTALQLKEQNYDVMHIHRIDRKDFKAGALAEGLKYATGEFIAIFDADFVPPKEFLQKTIHFFTDENIGMVQTRWGHINAGYSMLTMAQSIFLDGHFAIEQMARSRSGRFFNFNGTAGMWRRECIESSGGWQNDTLTEDLDLSYRAQLNGWKFVFLQDTVSPAELPVEMNGFKSQQYRWTKGSIQTARKLLRDVLKSNLPLSIKLESIFHLTDYLAYLFSFVVVILILPAMSLRVDINRHQFLLVDLPLFLALIVSSSFFYVSSQKELYHNWISRIKNIPFIMAVAVGLSVNNAKAALEGLMGTRGEFIRTPKYRVETRQDRWVEKYYYAPGGISGYIELCLGVYFSYAIFYALYHRMYPSIPFLLIFQVGFIYIGYLSLFQRRFKRCVVRFPVLSQDE